MIYFLSDIAEFSKKKNNTLRNLAIGGGTLTTLGAIAILAKGKNRQAVASAAKTAEQPTNAVKALREIKVKSYIRNGKTIRAFKRRQLTKLKEELKLAGDGIPATRINLPGVKDFDAQVAASSFNKSETFDNIRKAFDLHKLDKRYNSGSTFGAIRKKYIADNNISEVEAKSISFYVGGKYEKLQNYLLTGEGDDYIKQVVDTLDKTLDKLPVLPNREVYRYLERPTDTAAIVANYTVGKRLVEPRYTSSTTNAVFRKDWVNNSDIRFIIKTKAKNTNAVDIRGYNGREEEVLFKRNTSFQVVSVKYKEEFNYRSPNGGKYAHKWKGYEIHLEED